MVTIGCNQISTTRVVLNYLKILIFFFNIEEKKNNLFVTVLINTTLHYV